MSALRGPRDMPGMEGYLNLTPIFIAFLLMDFMIPAPGGAPAGDASALAARGADPAILLVASQRCFVRTMSPASTGYKRA